MKDVKRLEVGDKITLDNIEFEVISRDDTVFSPPEYRLKNAETGEEHGPVFWQWLNR